VSSFHVDDDEFERRVEIATEYPNHGVWYLQAILDGKVHPCPICKATGNRQDALKEVYPDAKAWPKLPCWHCNGTGDESATVRRNLQGRPKR
jgi:hypothetical protein